MRSVFVHLWETTEHRVWQQLDVLYPGQRDPWIGWANDDACLYIGFYRDGWNEDDDWAGQFAAVGGPPAVSVIADISGRHDGWPETQAFVVELLSEFRGVATDDAWARLWTREEIAADRAVDGLRFGAWRDHDARAARE